MDDLIDEPPARAIRPRNGFIAFLLSLFLPGLGQVYNGQPKKAIIFIGLLLIIPFLFGITRITTFFHGLISLCVIEIGLRIYIIVDGVKNANRQKDYTPKSYNTWYYHLLIAIGILIVFAVYDLRSVIGIQTFKIPTSSNNPTFQVGDWLVADMEAYNNKEPDYGDIVVYSRPDGQIFTFRIVGLPKDTLELVDNVISVNGRASKSSFIKKVNVDGIPVLEFEEQLPNGHQHLIYKFSRPYDGTKTNFKNIIVPPFNYYVLGDNRDNAADSRYEGFINEERIKGRIIYSLWGQTTSRINIDFRDK